MKYMGALSRAGEAVNDAYLKANRVKEGVLSYNMDTQLLIAFTRARGPEWYASPPTETGPGPVPPQAPVNSNPHSPWILTRLRAAGPTPTGLGPF